MSRISKILVGVCLAIIVAFLVGVLGPWLDMMDSQAEKVASVQSLIDATSKALSEKRKAKAAQELCFQSVGESLPVWTADGDLMCVPRKNQRK